jgi:pimeloyl-ACP methyl ester carboxylesterase
MLPALRAWLASPSRAWPLKSGPITPTPLACVLRGMELALEHHDVHTNGLRLHVVQCGPVEGPLVILLHGFPEYWESWRHQLPALVAAGYRVWVPDQRGYNLSDKPSGLRSYTLPVLAADVLGLLDAAGRRQAHLIGHDWGAIVTWYLAAHHPERLASTTIINVPHPSAGARNLWRVPSQLLHSWYIFFFQLPWLPEHLFSRRNWHFGARTLTATSWPGTFSPTELARYKVAWAQPGAITAMINWYRALRFAGRVQWPRITGPVQVIWGKKDAFLKARLAELSMSQCDHGQLHFFPNATHWVHLEEHQAVNELLVKFMATSPAIS